MNKSTIKLTVVFTIIMLLIAVGTVFAFIDSLSTHYDTPGVADTDTGSSEANTEEHKINLEQENKASEAKEVDTTKIIPDYETVYLDFIDKNVTWFSRGMMLYDLNDDQIPELFSLDYKGGETVRCFSYENGSISAHNDSKVVTCIDINNLIINTTFYENPTNFLGVYKNKSTGKKAIINSITFEDGTEMFDIITYDGKNFVVQENGSKGHYTKEDITKKRDLIMKDYQLVNDSIQASYILRGEYGGEYGSDAAEALKELITNFKKPAQKVTYKYADDGEMYCYVRNIDTEKGEIELVPAALITEKEYNDALATEGTRFTLNDESVKIQTSLNNEDDTMEKMGIALVYQMPWSVYYFEIPTVYDNSSVIDGYRGITPVKTKISKDFKIRYGVADLYTENGPAKFITNGKKSEYTLSEYLPHFAEYNLDSYYKALITDGEIVYLDVIYNEKLQEFKFLEKGW